MKVFLCRIAMILGIALFPLMAFAQVLPGANPTLPTGYKFEDEVNHCLNTPPASIDAAAWKDKYTARLVYCMRNMLEDATKTFLAKLVNDYAMKAISIVVVFALALFGIKVLGGMLRNPKAEAFSLLMKIGFILLIVTACKDPNHSTIVDFWFNTTDLMVEWIAGAGASAFGSTSFCPVSPNAIGQWFSIWDRFDCLFSRFMGIGGAAAIGTGFIAIGAAVVFSGGIGIFLFFMAFGAIIAIAQFLFRSVLMVLMSYGGLGLLILLLPLFLPLILFKVTEKFLWECWLRYAVGYVLQPALTIGFLLFALTVMDDLMINGSTNVYTVYDSASNTSRVGVLKPGEQMPPGARKAIVPPSEILGFSYADTKEQQMESVGGIYRRDKRMDVGKTPADAAAYSYMQNECGKAGIVTPGKNETPTTESNCTDKAACAKAALKKYSDAPSENTRLAYQKALCELGKHEKMAAQQAGETGDNAFDAGSADSVQLELNKQKTPNGMVAVGEVPDDTNQHDSKMMQLMGYVGAAILCCGTFLTFINTVPGLVQNVCGVPGQKISFASPMIAGKSLAQRIEGGMKTANYQWKKALKGDRKDDKFGARAARGFVAGLIKGDLDKNMDYDAVGWLRDKGMSLLPKKEPAKEAVTEEAKTEEKTPEEKKETVERVEAESKKEAEKTKDEKDDAKKKDEKNQEKNKEDVRKQAADMEEEDGTEKLETGSLHGVGDATRELADQVKAREAIEERSDSPQHETSTVDSDQGSKK